MADKRDLLILGGGLVGMTLALAAARKGISSHVVDRADPAELTADGFDGRASAISTASWNLFENIGLADALAPHGCPIQSIAVTDGMKPGRIDFRPEPHEGSLGVMFANRQLRLALFEAAKDEPLIDWHARSEVLKRERGEFGVSATISSGERLPASLMVAAEGRNSPTREEAGIAVAKWDYRHRAIITVLTHAKPHEGVAWEIFYPAGPFALLPMLDKPDGSHRSALVWTVNERDAAGVLALSDRAFIAEVEKRMHGLYGAIAVDGPRSSYPLGFHHTAKITAQRLALVGDAGHGLHPIAGQGLNVGLRDVGALVEVLVDGMRLGLDPGDKQLLTRYERWRGLDTFMVAFATDGLTRLFGIPGRIPSAIRRLGMGMVQRTPMLKTWFMDEARGTSGKLPELLRG
ncbi:MAG TPA: FAD-dependent monooxygenase [Croceibacterium sp.]|nr:FAD-dependent monooxygenase [Croceibacterium sp.]